MSSLEKQNAYCFWVSLLVLNTAHIIPSTKISQPLPGSMHQYYLFALQLVPRMPLVMWHVDVPNWMTNPQAKGHVLPMSGLWCNADIQHFLIERIYWCTEAMSATEPRNTVSVWQCNNLNKKMIQMWCKVMRLGNTNVSLFTLPKPGEVYKNPGKQQLCRKCWLSSQSCSTFYQLRSNFLE